MNLLNDFDNSIKSITGASTQGSFQSTGFTVPNAPLADGDGLPSQKLRNSNLRTGRVTRQLCHWFVPEMGVIPMFINPQSMAQTNSKQIQQERTKGGYVIQYWGEELLNLTLQGNTGSSGVEGLNVLYEIYRAEQYAFDATALTMSAESSVSGINDLVDSGIASIGGFTGALTEGLTDIVGLSGVQSQIPADVPSLAAMATGVELYYAGWVFRGFFKSMNITESVQQLGIWDYTINFIVTQRRGYRTNSLPWQRSPFINPIDADPSFRSFGSELAT